MKGEMKKTMVLNREIEIEDAVINHPDKLGCPGATAIRNVRVAWGFGPIEVMLFPPAGLAASVGIASTRVRSQRS